MMLRVLSVQFLSLLLLIASIHCQSNLPNIVVLITDDLDTVLGGDSPLTKTHGWINDNGVTFNNAFASVTVCCPSRSSMLTGLYQHNSGAVNNSIAGGCSSPSWQAGPERQTYATFAKQAGYVTFYTGKYLNKYGSDEAGGVAHIPDGWDFWAGLVGNSVYYDYELSVNGISEIHGSNYEEDYLTDVLGRKANSFLDFYFDQIGTNFPFLMVVSTSAPHEPYIPAPQYEDRYLNEQAPRDPAFNWVDEDEGAYPKHWFVRQDPRPLTDEMIEYVDSFYRDRLKTMLSVDDLFDDLLSRLDSVGALDNTYVIFTSDHGYHLGQFAMPRDKRSPYEFDIRVPMAVRGPGVRQNVQEEAMVTLVDLAPTIIDMAGVSVPESMDGTSFLPWVQEDSDLNNLPEQHSFLISFNGEEYGESCNGVPMIGLGDCDPLFDCKCQDATNNTYTCIRTLSSSENSLFCQFDDDDNMEEFYDLQLDPYQLFNTAPDLDANVRLAYVEKLDDLRSCSGRAECFQP